MIRNNQPDLFYNDWIRFSFQCCKEKPPLNTLVEILFNIIKACIVADRIKDVHTGSLRTGTSCKYFLLRQAGGVR